MSEPNVNMARVVRPEEIAGVDAEDTALLRDMLARAERYISSFDWCGGVDQSYFGLGVGGIVAVFLFRIRPLREGVDEWLWVVVGDLPPAYLVTDNAPNPGCALAGYLELMGEWVHAVRSGRLVDDLIPVNVEPTIEWADQLGGRLDFIRAKILPRHATDLEACPDE